MIAVKGNEMKKIDEAAITLGIPGIVLMENAARSFVDLFLMDYDNSDAYITVVCGVGNNGGDGFAICRMLLQKKYNVQVVVVGDISKLKDDAKINYEILINLDIPINYLNSKTDIDEYFNKLPHKSYIIDAIFGIGCIRIIEGINKLVIDKINKSNANIYSVDIPSGINADNGRIMGTAVKAKKTITFCLPKVGLFLYPGAALTGDVIVADIGIPEKVISSNNFQYELIDHSYKKLLPKRTQKSHKGTYGKVLIIAGSKSMMGAAILSASSAYKAGCGLVKIFTEEGNENALFTSLPEAIIETYKRDENNFDTELSKLKDDISWADSILMGPGMTADKFTLEILKTVLEFNEKAIILDADALNVLSKNMDLLSSSKAQIIVTPHIGEMSRLTGYPSDDILDHTVEFAMAFSKKYQVITVLKSCRTIVADDNIIWINILGNNGMATAGSGDVLSGIIASLLAQSKQRILSAVLGVYVHSVAGDEAKKIHGEYSMLSGDIVNSISHVMK